MKKILFMTPSLGMGGMERVLVNYANLFQKHGYEVTIYNFTYGDKAITSLINPKVLYYEEYNPVPHFSHAKLRDILNLNFRLLSRKRWFRFHSAKYLYKKYVREKFDIVVGFCGSYTIKVASGAGKGIVQVGWIHGDNIENDFPSLGGFYNSRKLYLTIENLICVSDIAVSDIKKVFKRENKIYKVINPNDNEAILTMGKETVERTDELTFICVGRIANYCKGFDRVLSAAAKLKENGYKFKIWIVGDGMDYENLKKQKQELKLDNVILWGQQANPYKFISSADVFLMPSVNEAYGMVVTEALILGKPVISTNTYGPVEILENGKYGMIVENSTDGIYKGIQKVLDNPSELKNLRYKASRSVNTFNPDVAIEKLEEIFVLDSET